MRASWRPPSLPATANWWTRALFGATLLRVDGEPSAEAKAVERLDEIIGARAGRPAGQALLHFLQRKVLSEVYRLDTKHMIYVVENFGPVDWRMVDAQSLYWVSLGLIRGGHSATSFQTDTVNTIRLIHFSLRNLFHRNRMSFEPNPDSIHTSYINCTPDVNFIESMHRSYITYGPMIDPDPGDVVRGRQHLPHRPHQLPDRGDSHALLRRPLGRGRALL